MNGYIAGFALGLSLIMAIGAQNAFVLRQGLTRRHVFWVCLICSVSDAVLIAAGVAGMGAAIAAMPVLSNAALWGGAAFLLWYGARAFRSAWRGGQSLEAAQGRAGGLSATVLTALALTWLNPHVYLDTVVLLGGISAQYPGQEWVFGLGAALGSFLFFLSLGYGARLLTPVFARPGAWRVLDLIVAGVMWSIALSLARG